MRKIFLVLLLNATLILAACQGKKDEPIIHVPIPVSQVTINKTALSLQEGAKATLTATVSPENVADKRVTWTSSEVSIATVSAQGEVVALKAGKTTITVTSVADNTKIATCEVIVTKNIVAVTGVTLNINSLSLVVGAKEMLLPTITPTEATNKEVTWTSSEVSIATVSAQGEVVALKAGKTTIAVTSVADNTKIATCEVTVVKKPVAVTGVALNKNSLALLHGQKETLTVTVSPNDASNTEATWSSSDASVATVSTTGEVIAVGGGSATITVKSVSDNTKSDACVVTVTVPVATTATVGNFYYADKVQTTVYDKSRICVGVVFWVDPNDNTKGKIVSLDEAELAWGEQVVTGANNNSNGRSNMYLLNEYMKTSRYNWSDFPAFEWVAKKNGRVAGGWEDTDWWYFPAQGDLVSLFGSGITKATVNVSLNKAGAGAIELTDFYTASNETGEDNAFFVSFYSGSSQEVPKSIPQKIRAVANF